MVSFELINQLFAIQGAVFTIHISEDGFASGSKDGSVILWDGDFKPITKIDMLNSVVGYKGEVLLVLALCIKDVIIHYFDCL